MSLESMDDLLLHELSDMLSAEQQFAKALKLVAKSADSAEIKKLAEQHGEETQGQIENLKEAFSILGKKPEKMVCKGAQGICEENESMIKEEKPKGAVKDMALIGGSLRIEHYEIAGYTGTISIARKLGQKEIVKLLQENLKQEKDAAKKLEAVGKDIG